MFKCKGRAAWGQSASKQTASVSSAATKASSKCEQVEKVKRDKNVRNCDKSAVAAAKDSDDDDEEEEIDKVPEVHGLNGRQQAHMRAELAKAKKFSTHLKCPSCKHAPDSAYMYYNFSKRGGRKKLYGCEVCLYHWSTFHCDEEDYDFLAN